MRNNKIYILITALAIVFLGSCKKDPEVGGTAVETMAGTWWVQSEEVGASYFQFATYNTSANSTTEMWLDDLSSFWGSASLGRVAGKVNVDLTNQTFSVAKTTNTNTGYPVSFTVSNGKIIKGGSIGPVSKAVTDSIYFEVEYTDDPGTVYHMSGYKRTKFSEDDH
ncbi:lipid-binding protein [Arcticibacter eurypsychrophilus]|uniref:lipid-binding protein n=1 Tax=Arcticibacter eurypsychrophilus TaxID=1434752 RepID=UPI00084D457C|nr:lipid-binding protein [Arcticibacter eurypsychrophilus]